MELFAPEMRRLHAGGRERVTGKSATCDQHELYAAMDWLVERQAAIEQRGNGLRLPGLLWLDGGP